MRETVPSPTVVELDDGLLPMPAGTRLFTTLEGENPTGSLKDRLVAGELTELLRDGALKPGDVVSEVSAGSTARSLAYYCRELGLGCSLFVPVTMPAEEVQRLQELGAAVRQVTRDEAYPAYERFCADNATHPFGQLFNPRMGRHYASLGATVAAHAGRIDVIVGAVGTGHSLLGSAAGITPRPVVVSAEPDQPGAIPGVRNVVLERYGEADACTPEQFDRRVVVPPDDLDAATVVPSDQGDIEVGESFRLVLAAAARFLSTDARPQRGFLLGAQNRRPGD